MVYYLHGGGRGLVASMSDRCMDNLGSIPDRPHKIDICFFSNSLSWTTVTNLNEYPARVSGIKL